jgi:LPXTG-site transpeptidase (sortase) family protein
MITRWIERALLALGIACLGYYTYTKAEARQFQREQAAAFARIADSEPTPGRRDAATGEAVRQDTIIDGLASAEARAVKGSAPAAHARTAAVAPGVLAMLEIPRLRVSAPVLSGDDERTLSLGVGHLPDTPRPWEPGNSALAGHRDGLFRPLRRIRVGDELRVRTPEGELRYQVRETRIVSPDDLSVLAPTETDALTLITCYPFNYVGPAPQRFIVRAVRDDTAATRD